MLSMKRLRRGGVLREDRIFDACVNGLLLLVLLVCLYPLYFVVIASVSEPDAINTGRVLLYPVGNADRWLNLEGYARALRESSIWRGYGNTLAYTAAGTILGVISTVLAGYALSRRDLDGRGPITGLYVFTMYFGGGLIPTYMVVRTLGLTNTPYVMMLLGSVSVYNIIIAKSFYQTTLSPELQEAAFIDGCGNGRFFLHVALPLSQAITAVLALYYAVGHWNAYFNALIYLNDEKLYPLQLVLRDILVASQILATDITDMESIGEAQRIAASLKYVVIILSTLPVLMLYPFLQRYFVKGVMIGSVKG